VREFDCPPDGLARLLRELRRRREEAAGRYELAVLSGHGWHPEGLRWIGAYLALDSVEQWARRQGLCDQR
jgi:hypothetical protein